MTNPKKTWRELCASVALGFNLGITLMLILVIFATRFDPDALGPLTLLWLASAVVYAYNRYPMTDSFPDN